VFLTNGPAEMPNWIQVLASAFGHRGRPPHQKPAQAQSQLCRIKQYCRLGCVNGYG
jgi:hypothetical protein